MQTQHTSLIEGFKTNGLYRLKYPTDLRASVIKALESWKKFVALPNSITDQFPYSAGVGYEHQKGTGPTDDRKQDFHFTFDGASLLSGMADGCSDEKLRSISHELIDAAGGLVEHLTPSVSSFAQDVETHFGLGGFKDELLASKGTWFVRFLYYPGNRKVGEATAVPHIDKSGITFHIFESAPGLQGLGYTDKKWFDTPVSDTETVIFPGYQLQYISEGKINALCHRVVANEETAQTGRYSMVVFFSLKNHPKYDKNSRGRLQDQEPGFNYGMPFEEVKEQFK